MLASNILTHSDFLKDSKEPLEIRKAMVVEIRRLHSVIDYQTPNEVHYQPVNNLDLKREEKLPKRHSEVK